MSLASIDKSEAALPTKDFKIYKLEITKDLSVKGNLTSHGCLSRPSGNFSVTGSSQLTGFSVSGITNGTISQSGDTLVITGAGTYKIDVNASGTYPTTAVIQLDTRVNTVAQSESIVAAQFVGTIPNSLQNSFCLSIPDDTPRSIDWTLFHATGAPGTMANCRANIQIIKL